MNKYERLLFKKFYFPHCIVGKDIPNGLQWRIVIKKDEKLGTQKVT